ncbi:hypothetical protein [Nocardia alni]|uniref:hypothetical protein n=1 Tax=Nocardia alni TaxID=2815723 RepID=UPI001C24F66E|nr:hypothetical protein [Nocardia alni]
MTAPIDPSISDLLRGSSLAPMMDQPVNHILQTMGLPPLPTIPAASPLPGLPPLPTIDLGAIVKPMTDMLSSFGTGHFGGAGSHPAADPASAARPAVKSALHPAVAAAPAAPSDSAPTQNATATQNTPATGNSAGTTQSGTGAQSTPAAAAPTSKPPAARSGSPKPAQSGSPAGSTAPGSGQPAHLNPDPTQVLQAITTGLQTALSLGSAALPILMQLWQGQGSQSAASTASQASSSGTQLVGQSTSQKAILGAGATSVATGGALMTGVVSKYLTTAAMTAPFLAVPGGQVFLAGATAESIAEGLAVLAKTRLEMTFHSANMTAAGHKVKVSSTPTGVSSAASSVSDAASSTASDASSAASSTTSSSSSGLEQLVQQLASPVSQLLSTGAQSIGQLATAARPATTDAAKSIDSVNSSGAGGDLMGESGSGGGGLGGGGVVTSAAPAAQLNPWTGTAAAEGSSLGAGTPEPAAVEPASATSSPGYMPMGGGGMGAMGMAKSTAAAGAADAGSQSNLVTGNNGDAVVGPLEGVSLPVVGAQANSQAIEAPPDKELTL